MKTLYKRNTDGSIQTWSIERNGHLYRSVSGKLGGQMIRANWTTAQPKNIGRANETSAEEQAIAEVEAHYRKKLEREYHLELEDIDKNRYFKPMLAHKFDAEKVTYPVFSQPKLDGIRCIATRDGLKTRNGKPINSCPHVWAEVQKVFEEFPGVLMLDGELYNHELKDDFNSLVSFIRKDKPAEGVEGVVQFHIYDLFADPQFTFAQRLAVVVSAVPEGQYEHLVRVPTSAILNSQDLDDLYGEYLEAGYEGQMVRIDAPYEQKRSKSLLKRKEFIDDEFSIVSIEEGKGNWAGYAKRLHFRLEDGRTCGAGVSGNQALLRDWYERRDTLIGQTATVRYFTPTPDGMPRFPVVKSINEGGRL